MKFDVIVSGAGAAGFGAAMGAARLGKKVLLLDTNGAPGGTTVFGGCPVLTANAPFDKMEPKGIFREFMEALGERCHIAEGNITCNTSEMDISLLMTRFLKAAGVTMLFYATLIEAQTVSDRIRNITVFCCGKKHTFEADYFVDATGDAVLHIGALVARHACRRFEIDLAVARNDAHEDSRAIATQHQRFEYLLDRLAQLLSHVAGIEVLLIDHIGNKFVGDFGAIEQSHSICFIDFCHRLCVFRAQIYKLYANFVLTKNATNGTTTESI